MVVGKDFVVSSPFPDIKIPGDVDIWSYLTRNIHNYPRRIAQIDADTRESITFCQLEELAETVAANLLKHGYRADRPLAIFMTNCLEYVVLCLAVWRLGGVVACINALLMHGEVKSEIDMVQSEFLVCSAANVETALKAARATHVQKVFCKSAHPSCMPLTSLTSVTDLSALPTRLDINQSQDTALILFSSGTTGLPKGVRLSHRSVVATCRLFGGPEVNKMAKETGIVYQPLSHVYGLGMAVTHIYWGLTAIIMPKFDLKQFIKLIEEHRVDQIHVVPPIMVMLASSELPRHHDLTCLRSISCGAAPLSEEVERQVANVIGSQCQIRQSWGMTETCTSIVATPSWEVCKKLSLSVAQGAIGVPSPNYSLKIIDINTGKNLGPYKEGEICVKSDYLMLGYVNNPEATERTLDSEGWLHTGDIGYYNEEGCFFVVDRLKELIKYKGYQVAPAELEALLLSHEGIVDAGVVGLSDAEGGEVPFAWIVRKSGVNIKEEQIHQFVSEHAAPFKKLRGGIRFVDEIPKSASGKILRREIRSVEEKNLAQAKKSKL